MQTYNAKQHGTYTKSRQNVHDVDSLHTSLVVTYFIIL